MKNWPVREVPIVRAASRACWSSLTPRSTVKPASDARRWMSIAQSSADRARQIASVLDAPDVRAIDLAGRLVSTYPSYRFRQQYQSLQARLLNSWPRVRARRNAAPRRA